MNEQKIQCPNCKKDIYSEAHFCPYCMTKFTENKEMNNPYTVKKKKRNILRAAYICLILLAVVIGVVVGIFLNSRNDNKKQDKSNSLKEVENEATENSSEMNYSQYIGEWYDEIKDKDNPRRATLDEGGTYINIIDIDEKSVLFNLCKVQMPPANRVATIENVKAIFQEDKKQANFMFEDDGWGNSGNGVLVFDEDTIYVVTSLTYQNSEAMWSISTDQTFTKANSIQTVPGALRGSLESVAVAKFKLGQQIKEEKNEDGPVYYMEYGTIYTCDGKVKKIVVDYSQIEDEKRAEVNYNLVGYNNSPQTVINQFGSENVDSDLDENGTGTMYCKENDNTDNFLDFIFEEGKIIKIVYYRD